MSFGKCFLFSLIAFIGLNVVFLLLAYLVSGEFDVLMAAFEADLMGTLGPLLFGPIASSGSPAMIMLSLGTAISLGTTIPTITIILMIGWFVAPIIGAFLSGFFAENRKEAFLGWFLTAIICTIIVMVLVIVEMLSGAIAPPPEYITGAIVMYLGFGLTIGLFYGCIALLTRRD